MKESTIEAKFYDEVKKRKGWCLKFTSPSMAGLPDRIVLLPGSKVAFVEFKAPGETMRPLQRLRKKKLEDLGFAVYCIDSTDMIPQVLGEMFAL